MSNPTHRTAGRGKRGNRSAVPLICFLILLIALAVILALLLRSRDLILSQPASDTGITESERRHTESRREQKDPENTPEAAPEETQAAAPAETPAEIAADEPAAVPADTPEPAAEPAQTTVSQPADQSASLQNALGEFLRQADPQTWTSFWFAAHPDAADDPEEVRKVIADAFSDPIPVWEERTEHPEGSVVFDAISDGQTLASVTLSSEGADWVVSDIQIYLENPSTLSIVVPEGYSVRCGGQLLDGSQAVAETRLGGMGDYYADQIVSPVRWYRYTVNTMLTAPSVSLVAPEDRPTVTTADGGVFYTLPEDEAQELRERSEYFVQTLLTYYMMGNYNTRGYMYSALNLCVQNSQAYQLIRDTYDGNIWNACYWDATYDIQAGDVLVLADNCVSVDVKYHTEGNSGTYHNVCDKTYRIYYMDTGYGYGIYGLYYAMPADYHDLVPTAPADETEQPKHGVEEEPGIEVVEIREPTYQGKMLIVHDPSRVIVGTLDYWGGTGWYLQEFMANYNAVYGTNAGSFEDPDGMGLGGSPDGLVMKDGVISWGSAYGYYNCVLGFDGDHILHVGNMTGQDALNLGLVTAVSFPPGPVLVQDGYKLPDLGGNLNPRTCVGQRADGAVLIVVIEGRNADSFGATFNDLADLLIAYGAVNGANLDGGTSSAMFHYTERITGGSSPDPRGGRPIATTILVLPEGDGN